MSRIIWLGSTSHYVVCCTQEMECLQEHLDDLAPDCQAAVGNFTEDEDEDISLDRILMKACAPMMKRFCEVSLKLF